LVTNADRIAKAIYKTRWGKISTFHQIINSKSWIQLIYKAKHAAIKCTKNLAQAGILNFIFQIYSNSVIISTITIKVHQAKNQSNNSFVHISGKNRAIIIRKIR
jgi:hypothetical protein